MNGRSEILMLKLPEARTESDKTIIVDSMRIEIPKWIGNLAAFRHWARSDEFPESGRICYFNEEMWVDMSKEQFYSHNQVKAEFDRVLGSITKLGRLGRWVPDGMLLSNVPARFSVQPDGCFFFHDTLKSGSIELIEGSESGFVELEGTPDMVLEVVSVGSVDKDNETLRDLYFQAGIAEYWLVDARGEKPVFDILRLGPKGYVATRKAAGWLKSSIFGQSFRLTRTLDERRNPEITLDVK